MVGLKRTVYLCCAVVSNAFTFQQDYSNSILLTCKEVKWLVNTAGTGSYTNPYPFMLLFSLINYNVTTHPLCFLVSTYSYLGLIKPEPSQIIVQNHRTGTFPL